MKILDKIFIKNFQLRMFIGINDDEKIYKQKIILDIVLFVDLEKIKFSKQLLDSVDYCLIQDDIIKILNQKGMA